jgi:hypothetical protein
MCSCQISSYIAKTPRDIDKIDLSITEIDRDSVETDRGTI